MKQKLKLNSRILKVFACLALIIGITLSGGVLAWKNKYQDMYTTEQNIYNDLKLNQEFTQNPYIVVGNNVYDYVQVCEQNGANPQSSLSKTSVISFDENGKLELVFYNDAAIKLSSLALEDDLIASKFQATKTPNGYIDIKLIDRTNIVNMLTSENAKYSLYNLAFSTNSVLNYEANTFSVGEKRGTTSLTDANSKTDAQVLNMEAGDIVYSGDKTYSPKTTVAEDGTVTITPGRAFHVADGTLTLTGITLDSFSTSAEGYLGGAIYMENGTLNLNCTINSCYAPTGGAILFDAGTVNVTGGTYTNNSADMGGVIACGGALNITDGIFSYNTASQVGGVAYAEAETATVNVSAGTFNNNSAGMGGGAIGSAAPVTISGGTFDKNSTTATETETLGGAVYVAISTHAISNATFTNNSAMAGAAVACMQGNITIEDCIFNGNASGYYGGAYVQVESTAVINNTIFTGNSSAQIGGAIVNIVGSLTLNDCTVTQNSAVQAVAGVASMDMGTLTITGGEYSENVCEGTCGAIATEGSTLIISGAEIKNNSATMGSAIGALGEFTLGPITLEGNVCTDETTQGDIAIYEGSYITLNQALTETITVYKEGITNFKDGDVATSYVAYSADSSILENSAEYIVLTNLPEKTWLTYEEKENYLVCSAYSGAGLYNIYSGEVIYTWKELIDNRDITVDGTTITDFNSSLTGKLVIEDGITVIAKNSFSGSSISQIEFPASITKLEDTFNSSQIDTVYITDLAAWCNVDIPTLLLDGVGIDNLYVNGEPATELIIPNGVTQIKANVFSSFDNITNVIIPASVQTVASTAFASCKSLKYFVVADSSTTLSTDGGVLYNYDKTELICYPAAKEDVSYMIANTTHTIHSRAFFNNKYLCSVGFPATLRTVNADAFYCEKLQNLYITDLEAFCLIDYENGWTAPLGYTSQYKGDLTEPNKLYLNNVLLTSLVIPSSITEIKQDAFSGIESITNVSFHGNITSVGSNAFLHCSGITSFTIPDNITSIGSYSFARTGAKSFTIGSGLTDIPNYAFSYNTSAVKYDFTAATVVPTIRGYTFSGINENCIIYVPSALYNEWKSAIYWRDIKDHIFAYDSTAGLYNAETGDLIYSWMELIDSGKLTLVGTQQISGFDETLGGKLVIANGITTVGDSAFRNNDLLVEVVLPETLTTIRSHAFRFCQGLTKIEIPDAVTEIGGYAFYGCVLLEEVVIGTGLTNIYSDAFYTQTSSSSPGILRVYIDTLEHWCSLSFYDISANPANGAEELYVNNQLLTDLVIPSTITEIKNYAFVNLKCLQTVDIHQNVTTIGKAVFHRAPNITSLNVNANNNYFSDENNQVLYNKNKTKLIYCIKTKSGSLTIPNTVTTIGESAFAYCQLLTGSLVIPSSVTTIENAAFDHCTKLTGTLNIPNTVTTLGSTVFQGCSGFTRLIIGNGVKRIEEWTFSGMYNVNQPVEMHGGITYLGGYAFQSFDDVSFYFIDHTTIPSYNGAYSNTNRYKVFVPSVLYDQWIAATGWVNIAAHIYPYDSSAGLFDADTGAEIYSWRELINGGYLTVDGSTITAFDKTLSGRLVISTSVSAIGDSAFYQCNLVSVYIPNSVTTIGMQAFTFSTELQSVSMQDSVTSIGEATFSMCTKLETITLSNSVTSLQNNLFYWSAIKKITIPKSCTSIGSNVFTRCASLTSIGVALGNSTYSSYSGVLYTRNNVKALICPEGKIGTYTFPSETTTVGEGAFYNSSLTVINLKEGLTTIEKEGFKNCNNLSSITLPNSLTTIGDNAFDSCHNLINVSFGSGDLTIGAYAFANVYGHELSTEEYNEYYFTNATSIPTLASGVFSASMLSNSVTNEPCSAIYVPAALYNNWIAEPTWADYVKYIVPIGGETEEPGLYNSTTGEVIYTWQQLINYGHAVVTDGVLTEFNSSLAGKLILSTDVTSIAAMFEDSKLTEIYLANSVTSIDDGVFAFATDLKAINVSVTNGTFISVDGVLFSKDRTRLIAYPCGKEGTSYSIPDTTLIIGVAAFAYAVNLTSITIPTSVQSIYDGAFVYCIGLTGTLTIPEGVQTIGSATFGFCTGLTSISIPSTVTSIGDMSFIYCFGLTSISVNSSNLNYSSNNGVLFDKQATVLICYPAGKTATSYSVPNTVTELYTYSFAMLQNLTSVTIPSSVTTIGEYAFTSESGDYVTKLATVTLNTGLITIGAYAFNYNEALTSINIPNSVTSVGQYAFYRCTALQSVTLGTGLTSISAYTFYYCTNLKNLTLGANITSIGNYAFQNCAITSLTLPSKLTTIEYYAFYGCTGLTTLTFPSTVNNIGDSAFGNCTNIISYYFTRHSEIPTAGLTIFSSINSNCKIYVPQHLLSSWSNATNWSTYRSYFVGIQLAGLYNSSGALVKDWNQLIADGDISVSSTTLTAINTSLEGRLVISDTIKTIYSSAISSNTGLTSIFVPSSVTNFSITDTDKSTSAVLTAIDVDTSNSYYSSLNGVLFNKNQTTLIYYPVAKTGTSYTIPTTVTTVGSRAFEASKNLTSITISSSVRTISNYAFMRCSKITSIVIPNNVTSIGSYSFKNCTSVNNLTIGTGFSSIPTGAFEGCTALTTVTVPSNITSVGNSAFKNCSAVTTYYFTSHSSVPSAGTTMFTGINSSCKIYVPESLVSSWKAATNWSTWQSYITGVIQAGLYNYDTGALVYTWEQLISYGVISVSADGTTLQSAQNDTSAKWKLVIPEGITTIASNVGTEATGLYEVVLPNTLTTLGDMVFAMSNITGTVILPGSITNFGAGAFGGCPLLTNFAIGMGNTKYAVTNGVLFNYAKTTLVAYPAGNARTSYSVPSNVKIIGAYSLAMAAKLTSLTLPSGLTTISMYSMAMMGGITTLNIPSSVTTIGEAAFAYNGQITKYNFSNHTKVPTCGELAFYGANGLCIYVPVNLYSSWSKATNWADYYYNIYADGIEPSQSPGLYDTSGGFTPWDTLVSNGSISQNGSSISNFNSSLTGTLVIPTSVTDIASSCFSSTKLSGVVLPSTIKSIGSQAFMQAQISSINLPHGLETVGDMAFAVCQYITSLTIPSTLVNVGSGMFAAMIACTSFSVESGHPFAYASDGVLYANYPVEDSVYKVLYAYPSGKLSTSYTIPTDTQIIMSYAFVYTKLTSIAIPNSVMSIEAYAFLGNQSLTSVTFSSGLMSIGERAFYSCALNGTLTITGTNLSIGAGAFQACSNITRLVLSNVSSIGNNAFRGCSAIQSITFGNSLTSIGTSAFEECDALTSVTIPNTVTSLGSWAFARCNKLTSITIGSGVSNIPDNFVFDSTALTGTLTIPSNIQTIGLMAFYQTGYSKVVFNQGIKTIGQGAFLKCSNLSTITWPTSSLTNIEGSAFYTCTALSGTITIPSSVTFIGTEAFYGCNRITKISGASGVTNIGEMAFYGCSSLTSYAFGNKIRYIGKSAFYQVPLSGAITISSTCVEIGESAFYGCTSITSVNMNNAPVNIGNIAFYGCTNLANLVLGSNIAYIGDSAFYGLTKLSGTLTIPTTCYSIGASAFQGCTGYTKLSLGAGIQTIGNLAFYGCSNLAGNITLPSNLRTIGDSAFYKLTKLTGSLVIGDYVTTIGDYAFQGCTGFTSLTIGSSVQTIGELAFYSCTGLTSLAFNSVSVTTIGTSALRGLTKVTGTITFPNTLTTIGDFAFHSATGITKFTFGTSLSNLGAGAFANCTSVTTYDFSRATRIPTLANTNCFNGITSSCKIVVNSSLYSSWITASNWSSRSSNIVSSASVSSVNVNLEDNIEPVKADINQLAVVNLSNKIEPTSSEDDDENK